MTEPARSEVAADDKVTKIQRRVLGVLSDLRATPTVGVVAEDPERGLTQIAKPV
ncbi:MAG: sulfoacetaldehyde dehydrogenase, partial [Pseudonocardiales bacterium]|nr:sulfoacetaldehyde dehydrogenase [Pseudonocardiales bacterium]